jgi:hypothetical protein
VGLHEVYGISIEQDAEDGHPPSGHKASKYPGEDVGE